MVLLIQGDPADTAAVREALRETAPGRIRLQCVEGLSMGLARIAGGGVDVVVLDLSQPGNAANGGTDSLATLHREAPSVPVIVLCDASDEGLGLKAMRGGAADYVIKEHAGQRLGCAIRAAIELVRKPLNPIGSRAPPPGKNGGSIAFLGAKGGAGATTVALNVASVLARRKRVILVEMRASFGTLSHLCGAPGLSRNLSRLLEQEPAAIGPAEVRSCLWPYKTIPGLSALFAPPLAGERMEIGLGHAQALTRALAGMADFVVFDLPASLSNANRAIIEDSGFLALVVERDPVCVHSGRLMARAIESWDAAPQVATVIVNRANLGCPMPMAEIDTQLGCLAFGVIPPEPDLCLRAQSARTPLVVFQPDSLVAESLIALGERLASASAAADRVNARS